jgi:organic radical activating enzyme
VGDNTRNAQITEACVAYIKTHPRWRLSLQTHKLAHFK